METLLDGEGRLGACLDVGLSVSSCFYNSTWAQGLSLVRAQANGMGAVG